MMIVNTYLALHAKGCSKYFLVNPFNTSHS